MNKSDLVAAIAEKIDQPKAVVAAVIDELPTVVAQALKAGDTVAIHGLGTFDVRERAERTGRNPKTGDSITIAASRKPGFKPAKAFTDKL